MAQGRVQQESLEDLPRGNGRESFSMTFEERSRLTREALADLDAGRVIYHQAVQTWADSLNTKTPLSLPR